MLRRPCVIALAFAAWVSQATAQQLVHTPSTRGPRFLLASSPRPVPLDVGRTPVLRRRLALAFDNVPLKRALDEIAAQSGLQLVYSDDVLPVHARVSLRAEGITVAAALADVLVDAGVDIVFSKYNRAALVERSTLHGARALGSIHGTVTDAKTREPLEAVTVQVEGTKLGALSGDDGRYTIADVPVGAHTVSARRLGYAKVTQVVTVAAGRETTANFALEKAATALDQVVVTATGDQARREVGNAIATVQVDSLLRGAPATNLSQVLAGRVAGVQVLFMGGLTGVSSPINIRGQNSFSLSNQPLLVVDGVRVANSTTSTATPPVYAGPASGRFNDLDPAEIESIEIVKGPAAATLYGTDAANGVILVKTKRGEGGAPRWRVFAEGGVLGFDRERFPTSYFPWGHATSGSASSIRCTLLAVAAGTCVQDSVTNFSPLRNAETTPIGSGSRHHLGVQVSGGSAIRYFLSGTAESETGYLKMPSTDRALLEEQAGRRLTDAELHPNAVTKYGIRSNLSAPLSPSTDIHVSAAMSHSDIRVPLLYSLLFGGLATGVRDQNDGWTFGQRAGDYLIKKNREHVSHFTGGLTTNWHPNGWLTGRLTAGLDLSTDYADRLAQAGLGFSAGTRLGARDNTKINTTLQTIDAGLSATHALAASLSTRTSLGAQYNRQTVLTNTAAAQNLTPGSETVAGGAIPLVSESTVESVVAGAYAEETLGWRDRLYLTGAVRVDGASSFGSGFRAAVYPKASLSWLLSEEPFWPRLPGVSSLRLRAAYGQSGVQPGPVAALASEALFPAVTSGGATTGARLGALGNRDLRPERQREIEAGLDLELFDRRVAIEATYYDKRSTDALVSVALPSSFGGGAQWQNVGAVRNRGYEALVRAQVLATPALSWSVTFNGSVNDNTLLTIAPTIDAIYNTGLVIPSLVPGYPLYSHFDYPIERVADANGNGIIEPDEVTVDDTPKFGGSAFPRTQLSGTTTLGLFGDRLKLAATVERRSGYSILHASESQRCIFGACVAAALPNAPFSVQAANVARATAALHKTYWGYFEDGSFTRLRELSLTYALPESATRWLRARDASITLSGRNLALWSAYTGTDPEVLSYASSTSQTAAEDATGVPAPTYWLLRVNLGF